MFVVLFLHKSSQQAVICHCHIIRSRDPVFASDLRWDDWCQDQSVRPLSSIKYKKKETLLFFLQREFLVFFYRFDDAFALNMQLIMETEYIL